MTKEVVQAPVKKDVATYLKQESVKTRLSQALGAKANIDEFLSNVLVEIGKSPALQACTIDSILQCAIDSANFGLIPNKQLGHAYLIPYAKECTLQIGYKGYIKKFAENGMTIDAEIVTKREVAEERFKETRGSSPYIFHEPIREGVRTKTDIALVYAIGKKAGVADTIAVMSLEEVIAVSKTKGSVWKSTERDTDYGQMCLKTVIRRLSKLVGIDVVTRMSSYEGEKEEYISKNRTIEGDYTSDSTANRRQADDFNQTLREKKQAKENVSVVEIPKEDAKPDAGTPANQDVSEPEVSAIDAKAQEIINLIETSRNPQQAYDDNHHHVLCMPESLQNKVYDALRNSL